MRAPGLKNKVNLGGRRSHADRSGPTVARGCVVLAGCADSRALAGGGLAASRDATSGYRAASASVAGSGRPWANGGMSASPTTMA